MNSKISRTTQYFPNSSNNEFNVWKCRSITEYKARFSGITTAFLPVGNMVYIVSDYSLSKFPEGVQSDFSGSQMGYRKSKVNLLTV